MDNEIYLGAVDTQSQEQKEKNYKFNEVCAGPTPVIWTEKKVWRTFPIRDQDGSGQCVKMTESKEKSIILQEKYGEYTEVSSSFGYQQRSNPSLSGCNSHDIYTIFPAIGDIPEALMPSQKMSDVQVMALHRPAYLSDLAKVWKFMRIELPIDFETVASTIQATGKGVMVWFKFSMPEWTDIPQVLDKPITSGHSVCAVDFTLKDGKKYLVIDDSWGLAYAIKGQRLISEEYFKARCFLASYIMSFQVQNNATVAIRPKFDGSIVSAQKCFKWEGLFPANVPEIENWGNITRKACKEFQKRYGIEPALGNFGPLTKEKLTQLYSE